MRRWRTPLAQLVPFIVWLSLGLNVTFFSLLQTNRKVEDKLIISSTHLVWPSPIGSFRVLSNFMPSASAKRFDYHESVSLTTHATPEFLFHLGELSSRWRGPISVAVYAPGSDLTTVIRIIHHFQVCGDDGVRHFVSFHVFFPENSIPNELVKESVRVNLEAPNCSESPAGLVRSGDTYRFKHNLTYPVNTARNIARILAKTHFILASDAELYPSKNVAAKFLEMVDHQPPTPAFPPRVYVLPIFEVEKDSILPNTKRELAKLVLEKKAVTFHKYLCVKCHRIPDEDKWLNRSEQDWMSVFLVTPRKPGWEPIFIGTNREPLYDERITWEAMGDKMTQMFEMCLMNYELHILDNAFLVHSPGIKRNVTVNLKWRLEHIKKRRRLKEQLISEIKSRHPKGPNCTSNNM